MCMCVCMCVGVSVWWLEVWESFCNRCVCNEALKGRGGGVWERTVGGHAELEIADDRLDNDASVFERDGLDSRTQFFLVLSLLPAHIAHWHASSTAAARHLHTL